MDKEFDKTKVYTPLNITKDLIGAKGYFDDEIWRLKEEFYLGNLDSIGEVVGFNENVIFMDKLTNPSGWQFFYLVEMPKEKQEKC